jgi:cell division protein FtsZ
MTINLKVPDIRELKPRITVFGVGGAGGNAVNNMIELGLQGCEFVVGNTDAQALTSSKAHRVIQMGLQVTEGLGAGSQPEIGQAAAEEVIDEIRDQLAGAHMVFVTAGMGGGTGTGAAPVVARAARDMGILTVGVVTKPFQFEGTRRMRLADQGIEELQKSVDTLIIIPNQNLFRIANEQTTFADAFAMADKVLYSGVACITDLMVKEGLINLDFADVRAVMREMGKAMMGTGEATGEKRAMRAAEAAIANPLLDDVCMKGARGLLISITGGADLTLYEVDEAATRIREEVDPEANVIFGATRDDSLEGIVRVSVVATGIDHEDIMARLNPGRTEERIVATAERLRAITAQQAPQPAARPVTPVAAPATPVIEPQWRQPEPVAVQQPAPQPAMHQPHHQPAPQPMMRSDVTVRPAAPKMNYETAPVPQPVAHQPEPAPYMQAGQFVPPAPEQPMRPAQMPNIADFPPVAQRQFEQAREPIAAPVEKKRTSLLDRLTAAGFGRRAEPEAPAPQPVRMQQPQQPALQAQPMPQAAPAAQEFAKRAAPAPRPQQRLTEDDQLEIPAFLRRQSN